MQIELNTAFAELSERFSQIPDEYELPRTGRVFQLRDPQAKSLSRSDFVWMSARMVAVSLISCTESYLTDLFVIRRWVESVIEGNGQLDGETANTIRRRVLSQEARTSPGNLTAKIVLNPSSDLTRANAWLDSIYRLRVCLAHRNGVVDVPDVDGNDQLVTLWRKTRLYLEGEEITRLPTPVKKGQVITIQLSDESRTYAVGQSINVSMQDCHDMAFSLSYLGSLVANELASESCRSTVLE